MEEALRPHIGLLRERAELRADSDLVSACIAGDGDAFRELLSRYRKSAFALAHQMLGDADDAEDISQEAFVKVFQALPRFRREAAFSTWLYRIVTNLCLARIRRNRAVVALDSVGEMRSSEDPSRRVTESLLTRQVLSQMVPELRAILLLRDQLGLSYREISRTIAVPVGTVRSRLSKARAVFRALWQEATVLEEAAQA